MDFIGCHYDIARGAYLKPAVFERALDLAAASGFTQFIPYLENMIHLPSIRKACPSCAYDRDQWQAFETAARKLKIDLVPHFNVIGHTERIGPHYPQLSNHAGDSDVDFTLPQVRNWTFNCLEEFSAFSASPYFLIGGDEWQPSNEFLQHSSLSPAQVWVDQINSCVEYLVTQGKTPVIWHDMLMHFPENLDKLSRDAMIAVWFYDEDSDYPVLDMLRDLGFKTIMASGTTGGTLSSRRVRAIQCALKSAQTHQTQGFWVTNWERCRWEQGSVILACLGNLLRGEEVPKVITETMDMLELLVRLSPQSTLGISSMNRLRDLAQDRIWQAFPEFSEYLAAFISGDRDRDRQSYEKYHYPEGRLYQSLITSEKISGRKARVMIEKSHLSENQKFTLDVNEDPKLGTVLRVHNMDETFAIYPRFGATLQDWRSGDISIIPHSLPSVLNQLHLPGGYRSYVAVGGMRPIWGLGTHHNPCILWQFPFDWKILDQTDDRIRMEFKRQFHHVEITYIISVEKGKSGFVYEALAVNRLPAVSYGGFNFNLILSVLDHELDGISFAWKNEGRLCRTSFSERMKSFFKIPTDSLTVFTPHGTIAIEADARETEGFFIDWSANHVTPDLHGRYHQLSAGESVQTRWRLSIL